MISAVSWVPRGAAKPVPVVAEVTEEELAAMKAAAEAAQNATPGEEDTEEEEDSEDDDWEEATEEEAMEAEEDSAAAAVDRAKAVAKALKAEGKKSKKIAKKKQTTGADSIADGLAELDMDNYDDEEDEAGATRLFGHANLGGALFLDNNKDPYITLKEDEDSEEIDDFTIRDSDLLLLAARNEDDVSHIEVYVYEEADQDGNDNLYVHHDIMLPAFPLCLAWMDCDPRGGATSAETKGNLVAVGTLAPEIEIWDLDVLDGIEPVTTLGGAEGPSARTAEEPEDERGKKKKKKKSKSKKHLKEGSHSDSVLGLAWNSEYRNVLASASADCTAKVWDVVAGKCEHTLQHHSGKVQTVAWNPTEASVLLTGAFDRTTQLVDLRAPQHAALVWAVSADVECAAWDPHFPHYFVVSTEDGLVRCHDVRKGGAASSRGGGTRVPKGCTCCRRMKSPRARCPLIGPLQISWQRGQQIRW